MLWFLLNLHVKLEKQHICLNWKRKRERRERARERGGRERERERGGEREREKREREERERERRRRERDRDRERVSYRTISDSYTRRSYRDLAARDISSLRERERERGGKRQVSFRWTIFSFDYKQDKKKACFNVGHADGLSMLITL